MNLDKRIKFSFIGSIVNVILMLITLAAALIISEVNPTLARYNPLLNWYNYIIPFFIFCFATIVFVFRYAILESKR